MTRTGCFTVPAIACLLLFQALTCGLGVFADAPAEAPDPVESDPRRQVVQMELAGQDDSSTKLGYGNCQWLYPLEAAPEKLLQEPKYLSENPVYYAAELGDAEDNVFAFVIDESGGPGEGYDVLYADLNNDNRIDPQKERFEFRLSTTSRDDPLRISLLVTAHGVTAPYFVNFSAFPYCDHKYLLEKIHANLRNSSYYQGQAVLLGSRRKIAIADLDTNGLFNDVEQRLFQGDRFFVDLDDQDQSRGRGDRMESFPYGAYTRIEGVWYSIVASPDGSQVEITRQEPALGKIEAPSRISGATLTSATQGLALKFVDGSDQAVVGTYRVQSVRLLAEGVLSEDQSLQGSFGGQELELTVLEGQTTPLVAGLPLKVEPQVVVDEERTLRISLRVSGAGGETYRLTGRGGESSAGFKIFDSSGESIASGDFEYG